MVLGEWPGGDGGGNSREGSCGVLVRPAVGILAPGASLGDLYKKKINAICFMHLSLSSTLHIILF